MRILILAMTLFTCSIAAAENAASVAFTHECASMTQTADGFECKGLDGDLLRLNMSDWTKLDSKTKEHYRYRLNAFLLRYFDLGGVNFTLTSPAWPKGAYKYCSRPRNKLTYSCWDR